MRAKAIVYHDDDCGETLQGGKCEKCGFIPDMQSLGMMYFCPVCNVEVESYMSKLNITTAVTTTGKLKTPICAKSVQSNF